MRLGMVSFARCHNFPLGYLSFRLPKNIRVNCLAITSNQRTLAHDFPYSITEQKGGIRIRSESLRMTLLDGAGRYCLSGSGHSTWVLFCSGCLRTAKKN